LIQSNSSKLQGSRCSRCLLWNPDLQFAVIREVLLRTCLLLGSLCWAEMQYLEPDFYLVLRIRRWIPEHFSKQCAQRLNMWPVGTGCWILSTPVFPLIFHYSLGTTELLSSLCWYCLLHRSLAYGCHKVNAIWEIRPLVPKPGFCIILILSFDLDSATDEAVRIRNVVQGESSNGLEQDW
jgi:hypothetical protein